MINEPTDTIQNFSYSRVDGSISVWDNPNFKAVLRLPDNYHALTETRKCLEEMWKWSEEIQRQRITILKIIGDAVCATEAQLRRYLKGIMSPSKTSAHLQALRKHGFVYRFKCSLYGYEDEFGDPLPLNVPAPITLGYAGYLLLSHFFHGQYFAHPDTWTTSTHVDGSSGTIQRYVAMNEIRCKFAEQGIVRGWKWYPTVGGQRLNSKPFAVMQVGEYDKENEDDSRAYFIFERAQSKQNYRNFLESRLFQYRQMYEEKGYIQLEGAPHDSDRAVVISVSTEKIARMLQQEIGLHKYPFPVWFLVDEWLDTADSDIQKAFARPSDVDKMEITRFGLELLA